MTWHAPGAGGGWDGHCVLRRDNIFDAQGCGAGCDHVSAQKTAGWAPARRDCGGGGAVVCHACERGKKSGGRG
jgi:hypothetical protein